MGMDLYIMRYKNRRTPNEISEELYYARKFWNLLDAQFIQGYQDDYYDDQSPNGQPSQALHHQAEGAK